MSLRRRLVLAGCALVAVLLATNLLLAQRLEGALLDRLDAQLATSVEPALRLARPPGARLRPDEAPAAAEAYTDLFIGLVSRDGTVRRFGQGLLDPEASPPAPSLPVVAANAAPLGSTFEPFTVPSADGTSRWRVVAVAVDVQRGERLGVSAILIGADLSGLEATVRRLRAVQAVGSLAVLLTLAAAAWWVLRLGVQPLEEMADTADAIAGGDLSLRVPDRDAGTEAARLATALNAMLGEIESAFAARSATEAQLRRFAADASHELRTPLTSIAGYAELWEAGGLRGEDELADAMRRIRQEARRMGSLVEDLLLLARLDQHRPLERAPVRLDELAEDAVRDARAVEPDRPVSIESVPVVVDGDEGRLRQVVSNLLANARVHTPPGTPVEVAVERRGGVARLSVRDHGPGLAPEDAARVFDRFYRVDAGRARAAGGAGLGLAIVAAVAEAHGGRAGVTSRRGEGATFTVELPLSASADS